MILSFPDNCRLSEVLFRRGAPGSRPYWDKARSDAGRRETRGSIGTGVCTLDHFPTCTRFLLWLLSDIFTAMHRCLPRKIRLLLITPTLRASPRSYLPFRALSSRLHTMSLPTTMRAITFAKNGGVEVIDLTPDLPVPEPGPADVVIKVAYAGVNFIDTYFRCAALSRHCRPRLTYTCTAQGCIPQRYSQASWVWRSPGLLCDSRRTRPCSTTRSSRSEALRLGRRLPQSVCNPLLHGLCSSYILCM
jgi:hypothetical protein